MIPLRLVVTLVSMAASAGPYLTIAWPVPPIALDDTQLASGLTVSLDILFKLCPTKSLDELQPRPYLMSI